jgi:hypothetical protein
VGGTGAITCTRASLSVGPPVAFTIVVKVNPGVSIGTVITETATVSSSTTDPNPANNSATTVTTVSGCGPHTTHLHISTVPPSHSGNVSHEHHGQHGHTVVGNCPPHAPGHSSGFKPDPGGELFSLPFAAEPQDFVVLGRGQGDAGPVKPGAVFRLFGSVAGAFLGNQDASALTPPVSGSLRYYTTSLPVVRIGGLPAKVLFSGLAPGLKGVWQVEVLVPEGAPVGKLPVSVTYEGDEMRAGDVVVE